MQPVGTMLMSFASAAELGEGLHSSGNRFRENPDYSGIFKLEHEYEIHQIYDLWRALIEKGMLNRRR